MEFLPRAAKLRGIMGCEHDMRELLTGLIASVGTQKSVAEMMGISQAYLGDILRGKKALGEKTAARLGWRRMTVFIIKGENS